MAKRILAVLLAAVLTLSLAACSGNTETSGTGSDSSAAGESGTEGTGETDLREPELVTLDIVTTSRKSSVWIWNPSRRSRTSRKF